jgi:hypothetical protein
VRRVIIAWNQILTVSISADPYAAETDFCGLLKDHARFIDSNPDNDQEQEEKNYDKWLMVYCIPSFFPLPHVMVPLLHFKTNLSPIGKKQILHGALWYYGVDLLCGIAVDNAQFNCKRIVLVSQGWCCITSTYLADRRSDLAMGIDPISPAPQAQLILQNYRGLIPLQLKKLNRRCVLQKNTVISIC